MAYLKGLGKELFNVNVTTLAQKIGDEHPANIQIEWGGDI